MYSRLLLLQSAARPAYLSQLVTARRTLTQTTTRYLKESASHNPDPEAAHKHKQDSLDKQKKGQGHWKPELASDSEENVKADRIPHEKGEEAVRRLQERTKAAAEETARHGTSMKDGL